MHFDQRTQRALREVGLSTDDYPERAVDSLDRTPEPTVHGRARFAGDRETLR